MEQHWPVARIRIGLSGWSYREWVGPFYPPALPAADRLSFVAAHFDTVEVNRSFYSLLRPHTYREWRGAVPGDFVFAVKGSRFITHLKKLADHEVPLANFFASGVLELGEKLGPILWQLPGRWRYDPERVGSFLRFLPRTTAAALDVAARHDDRVDDSYSRDLADRTLRHVLEVRDPSCFVPELPEMLAELDVGFAISHSSAWPYAEDITTDLVYVRLHGPGALYSSPYPESELEDWSARARAWAAGDDPEIGPTIGGPRHLPRRPRQVYIYFDNDAGAHAPADALRLRRLVGEST